MKPLYQIQNWKRCQNAFIVFLCLVYSDGMPSTAIGDIYIPDVNDGSKLKVKFASGKFLHSHSMQSIANVLKIHDNLKF